MGERACGQQSARLSFFRGGKTMAKRRLKLSTPTEVRRALSKVANMVLNGELDPRAANSIILACNAVLSAIRTDEQEKRLCELERRLAE